MSSTPESPSPLTVNRARSRNATIAFALVIGALVVNGVLTWLNALELRDNVQAVAHSHEFLGELKSLVATVIDAETGQRGYLITGLPEYLEPYQAAEKRVNLRLVNVARLAVDNPRHKADIAELNTLIDRRMDLIRQNIALRQEQGFAASRDTILSGEGKIIMDAIRQLTSRMELEEHRLLAERKVAAEGSYWTALATGFVAVSLGLVLASAGYVLVLRDIQSRNRAEAGLQEVNARLEERVRERTAAISDANEALRDQMQVRQQAEEQAFQFALDLQRSNRELEQFAAVASHDLQEPLRKIQAFGDRLQSHCREELGERGRDYLDRMLASAARMRQLIDDLLNYSRVTTKGNPFSTVDLAALARAVVSDLESQLQRTGGSVEFTELPTVSADAAQLRQLFQNLISNALKFHRPNVPPEVRITGRQVPGPTSDGAPPRLLCELVFADNGIGFEQKYAERIFELFQRLHGRDDYEGTGMGLALCKKIAEHHGGTIMAQGVLGEGAKFVVTLPLDHPREGESP